ncbi:MAG: response regulator [Candidatus Omnitrophica bacterium]|nr:response regulator [Candidatus Omnitrophota bacterium]
MTKILLVEDDRELAGLTKIVLVKKGYNVDVVYDGLLVMDEVKKQRPDLILMDFMLPQFNGGDAVKALRKDPVSRDIPVVFLTALISSEEGLEDVGINIEGSNYKTLGKPYDIEHLVKVVEKALLKIGR